jgi:acetylglutamate kinase
MVYAGLINKKVVAMLNSIGTKAMGLSGVDGSLIVSNKREIVNNVDFGLVGDPVKSNTSLLKVLLNDSYVPVIAPVTFDLSGQLLNTNADSIAGFIGMELSSFYNVSIAYCFEFEGVLSNKNDDSSIISTIRDYDFNKLVTEGVIEDGMIPKITNALNAVKKGVNKVKIMSYKQLKNYEKEIGTTIY